MIDDLLPREERLTRNKPRKKRKEVRRGRSRPGGLIASCGCRWTRTGGAWRHVTPCRDHPLRGPAADEEMDMLLLGGAA